MPRKKPAQPAVDPITDRWTEEAKAKLEGKRIAEVRYMTTEEATLLGWDDRPVILILEDGSIFYPSRDDEGNGAGALFGSEVGRAVTLPVLRSR